MAKIFSGSVRVSAARAVDPLVRALLRLGVSPDVVTLVGTAGVVAGALLFATHGQFLVALLVVTGFALTDLLDGAMARARGRPTRFGAFLDSTMDRVADGAIFAAVGYWYASAGELAPVAAALICLVASQVISYVKARAQSVGIACDVGIAERAERLLLVGVGALGTGLGVAWALPAALWLLAILSLVTVGQRVIHVYRADRMPPAGGGDATVRDREGQDRQGQDREDMA